MQLIGVSPIFCVSCKVDCNAGVEQAVLMALVFVLW